MKFETIRHEVTDENLAKEVSSILNAGGYLLAVVGSDERELRGKFCIRYFFFTEQRKLRVLELLCEESFPSITPLCPAAKLYEREIKDMFGLEPVGHPDPRPLMLHPENWPPHLHPLRKDFDGRKPAMEKYGTYRYKDVEGVGINQILVGPIHAGIIEPGHFRFSLQGEAILQLEIRHFWKHRGVEKVAEGKDIEETLRLVQRISGDNAVNIGIAYLEAVEKLVGVDPHSRVKYLRVIVAELERVWNHVRDLGWLFMDIGATFVAYNLFSLQEKLLRFNKALTRHRFMFDILRVGDVKVSIDSTIAEEIKRILKEVKKEVEEIDTFVDKTPSVKDRWETTGRIFRKTALELALCGVCARASGVPRDTRLELPYLAYRDVGVNICTHEDGDVMARAKVRIDEVHESIRLVETLLDNLPAYQGSNTTFQIKPYEWSVGMAETPRGNAFFFVMLDEEGKIYRMKYVDPSFRNWPAIQYAVLGDIIADFPLVNKSMNLSYAGNDL
ncbi:NADH dehydrogenase (ubiquinone) 30 kDa subunit [Thermocrinis albus DSM 14484]|uniref:NADH dehydrogenase (Ubiquinone) 30 kDa subunit n=1 Tax=Thermocrinis albus (strain DSM 14484 / JCM 11386 / HI 11/12) TaxID=638303 RepID=D3SMS3_THEAH|nr:NADH-quinone oxidoreductase subunit C [Thermocrinis albus]ADC90053.1 NADH dehydrogenase (ubiquinone) 30 kDa subunit [Thermocrinis albus DSM 14484]